MSSSHKVIAVTCLAFEARIAAAAGVTVVCAARTQGLAALIEAAIADGCSGIASFGVAGGLDPRLRPGDWVVASHVVTENGQYPTEPSWTRRISEALPSAIQATILGVDKPVSHPSAKAQLHRTHGSVAVDTESHVAAQVAAARGIPFAAARVILDPAHRPLPPAALLPLRHDGSPDLRAIARSVRVVRRQLVPLTRLATDTFYARSALLFGSRSLGDALGFEIRQALPAAGTDAQENEELENEELALEAAQLPIQSL